MFCRQLELRAAHHLDLAEILAGQFGHRYVEEQVMFCRRIRYSKRSSGPSTVSRKISSASGEGSAEVARPAFQQRLVIDLRDRRAHLRTEIGAAVQVRACLNACGYAPMRLLSASPLPVVVSHPPRSAGRGAKEGLRASLGREGG